VQIASRLFLYQGESQSLIISYRLQSGSLLLFFILLIQGRVSVAVYLSRFARSPVLLKQQ